MKISIRKLYVISLSALITVACSSQSESEGMLIINNKTSEDITKVNLTYKTTNKSENIGNLSPNQSFKFYKIF